MAHPNGSIGTISGEYSSRYRLELVGQRLLVAFGCEEGQRGELVRVLQAGTVLQLHGDWLRESPREGHPVDPTDQLCVIWELVLATQAGLDAHGQSSSVWLQGICWNI